MARYGEFVELKWLVRQGFVEVMWLGRDGLWK